MLPRLKKCTVLQIKRGRKRSKKSEKEWEEMKNIIENKKENERKPLTIAELRRFKNYENVSDEQAQEIIFAVKNLAVIFYEHLNKKKKEQEFELLNNKAA